jgi:hypothetical protein
LFKTGQTAVEPQIDFGGMKIQLTWLRKRSLSVPLQFRFARGFLERSVAKTLFFSLTEMRLTLQPTQKHRAGTLAIAARGAKQINLRHQNKLGTPERTVRRGFLKSFFYFLP